MAFNAPAYRYASGLRDYTLVRRAHLHRESPSLRIPAIVNAPFGPS